MQPTLNFKWVKKTGRFQSGEALYINRIKVASYDWNVSSDHDENPYVGEVYLPSLIKQRFAGKEEKVKQEMERMVTAWFNEALKESV